MNTRRFALAISVLALVVPAAAFADDGIARLAKESSTPQVAMRVDVVLRATDPNEFPEKVGYTLSGLFALNAADGPSAEVPVTKTPFGDLSPSSLSTDELASLLVGLWDRRKEPVLAEAVNGLGGVLTKGHEGVTATLQEQLDGIVKMLGLGPAAPVPAQKGTDPNAVMLPPGWRLYADGDEGSDGGGGTDGGEGTLAGKRDAPPTPPPLVSINDDGGETVWLGDGTKIVYPGDHAGPERAPSAEQVRDAIIDAVKSVKKAADTYTSMPVYIGVKIEGGKETGLPTWGGMTINISLPPYNKYVDPDATGGTDAVASPEQVAARLQNELKDPMNPLDAQEPPPGDQHPAGGGDPTLEHWDPDSTTGTLSPGSDFKPFHGTAPIDPHPDAEPFNPQTNPAPTGDGPPVDGD